MKPTWRFTEFVISAYGGTMARLELTPHNKPWAKGQTWRHKPKSRSHLASSFELTGFAESIPFGMGWPHHGYAVLTGEVVRSSGFKRLGFTCTDRALLDVAPSHT